MYSTGIAYLLWLISGFGALGFHRFYLGKIGTGLLYVVTGGLFGVGCVYDLITLPLQVREANLRIGWRNALYGPQQQQPMRHVGGMSTSGSENGSNRSRKEPLEQVILKTAKRQNGVATPSEVALESGCSLDEVKAALEKLVEKNYAELRVSKRSGGLVYFFSEFSGDGSHPDLEDF
ncbi:MAG: TM2 domain-containing protein [Spirochaetota bacterium]